MKRSHLSELGFLGLNDFRKNSLPSAKFSLRTLLNLFPKLSALIYATASFQVQF
jgi:hypothetical protein